MVRAEFRQPVSSDDAGHRLWGKTEPVQAEPILRRAFGWAGGADIQALGRFWVPHLKHDTHTVLPLLTSQRIRRSTQLCNAITTDLATHEVTRETTGIDEFFRGRVARAPNE